MNKDRVAGKLRDVGGRIERQAGEWTGDREKQAHGTIKQVEGKVQNAWGKVKDAGKNAADKATTHKASRQGDDSLEGDAGTDEEDEEKG